MLTVSVSTCLLIAACGHSDNDKAVGGKDEQQHDQQVFAKSTDPTINSKEEEFPVKLRPVGVELSPIIGDDTSDPGKARLGMMFELRTKTKDRPTPLSAATSFGTWLLYDDSKKAADCDGGIYAPEPADGCPTDNSAASAVFDKGTANSGGIDLFYSRVMEETVDGEAEELEFGASYYIEIFGEEFPESTKLDDFRVCNENDPKKCVELGDLKQLPKRS